MLNLGIDDAHDATELALDWTVFVCDVAEGASPDLEGKTHAHQGRGRPPKSRKRGRPKGYAMHDKEQCTNRSLEYSRAARPPHKKKSTMHAGGRPSTSSSPFAGENGDDDNDEHASEGEGVECGDDEALEAEGPVLDDTPDADLNFVGVVPPEWQSGDRMEQDPLDTFWSLPAFNGLVYDKLPCPELSFHVVANLVKALPRQGHHVFFDRYFTSVKLLEHLHNEGRGGTGTYVSNRKNFLGKDMLHLGKQDRGALRFAYCEVKRMVGDGKKMLLPCPELVVRYIACKAGCDVFDSMVLRHGYSLQTTMHGWKWWHACFWGLMDSVFTNCWIIWKDMHGKNDTSKFDFMLRLHDQLVNNAFRPYVCKRPVVEDVHNGHFPMRLHELESKYCVVCAAKRKKLISEKKEVVGSKPSHSKWGCGKCKKTMCADPCFKEYHAKAVVDFLYDGKSQVTWRKEPAPLCMRQVLWAASPLFCARSRLFFCLQAGMRQVLWAASLVIVSGQLHVAMHVTGRLVTDDRVFFVFVYDR
ncbi:hypothetical protein L7F22_039852 [Adiantum nelumboides]|nr:hypothetical protein [Adiantum nelumboides]